MNLGFIILRHVNNEITNRYWIHCYKCIRNYYQENKILIIDDNSNYEYITSEILYNTKIINSEYHGRGELLPYYYYLYNKEFDTAIIIHDSVFINKKIDFSVNNYKVLWEFGHEWDQIENEVEMINMFDNLELKQFYEKKNKWKGCFGAMCIITHDYLVHINNNFKISKLIDYIKNKYNRQSFERVIACLLQINNDYSDNKIITSTETNTIENNDKEQSTTTITTIKNKQQTTTTTTTTTTSIIPRSIITTTTTKTIEMISDENINETLFGDIHEYGGSWNIKFEDKDKFNFLPCIKVWTGR